MAAQPWLLYFPAASSWDALSRGTLLLALQCDEPVSDVTGRRALGGLRCPEYSTQMPQLTTAEGCRLASPSQRLTQS